MDATAQKLCDLADGVLQPGAGRLYRYLRPAALHRLGEIDPHSNAENTLHYDGSPQVQTFAFGPSGVSTGKLEASLFQDQTLRSEAGRRELGL